MHYTGLTYRPSYEARSLLLQATTGCSHNACTFCSMYRDVPFRESPLEEIEEDLKECAQMGLAPHRVFLVNGDAFTLSAEKLCAIAEFIRNYLPTVETIGGYASITNIASKTDDDLRKLKELGYADFNIGLESALDDVLAFMNKGYTAEEAREQLLRLVQVGMPFNVNIINAAAGADRIVESVTANARLCNEVQPTLIFVSPLHVDPDTPLEKLVACGEYTECNLGDYIQEEIEFLKRLEQRRCVFFGIHVSNPIPVVGMLPQEKDRMVAQLEEGKGLYSKEELRSIPPKGSEGRILTE